MSIPTRLFVLAAAAGLTVGSVMLAAGPAQAQTSIAIPTAGIDLDSDAGMASMNRRIARAATQVCGNVDLRLLGLVTGFNACRYEAIAGANAQLGRVFLLSAAGAGSSVTVTAAP